MAQSKRSELHLNNVIANGLVTNWDDVTSIWRHAFYNEIRVAPEDHTVLLTEPPLNPSGHREKMTEIMMETFCVPALYIAVDAVLASYANGRTNCVVLSSGHGITHSVPVYEGHCIHSAITSTKFAGEAATNYLIKLQEEKGYAFSSHTEREIARDLKEKLCFVAYDYDKELVNFKEPNLPTDTSCYDLPDGNLLTIHSDRFQCPELFFQPHLAGINSIGVHETVVNSVEQTDVDLRNTMYANVLLSGGSTMFEGFADRVTKELSGMTTSDVKVIARPERKYSVWIGGATLAALSSFQEMTISRDDYDECGPQIVHRKCF